MNTNVPNRIIYGFTMSKQSIAVFDIDGTIFRSSLVIELTNTLVAAGIFPENAPEDYRENLERWQNREGEYEDYIQAVVQAFAAHANGVKEAHIQAMAETVVANLSRRTYRYTRDLIADLKKDYVLIAISGSPEVVVREFCREYGFDHYSATEYATKDGRYTGEFARNIHSKDRILNDMVETNGLSLTGSIGIGDTESDAAFLGIVEQPIAFNPNQALFDISEYNQWDVVVERKNVIYRLTRQDDAYVLDETD